MQKLSKLDKHKRSGPLPKMAKDDNGRPVLVALAGNPNVGKSTVFNSLTGLNQHTGNWPGKTVDLFYGMVSFQGKEYCLVDLPGTYSLRAASVEEEVARNFIVHEKPDVTVCIVDAANLERNLNFVFQVRALTPNCVVCLNLVDEAGLQGINIDVSELEKELGLFVIPTVARDGTGLDLLMEAIAAVATEYRKGQIDKAAKVASETSSGVSTEASLAVSSEVATAVPMAESSGVTSEIPSEALSEVLPAASSEVLSGVLSYEDVEQEIERNFEEATRISSKVISRKAPPKKNFTERFDDIVTSKALGVPLMLLLLGIVFFITLYLSNYPSDLLFVLFGKIEVWASAVLMYFGVPLWIHDLLVLGIYRTVAWVVAVMFPPMAIFFPMFTLLEDLGYLPRVAFNLDHIFQRCGGHGKQSLTMAMGFGCNAAGVVAARIIESPRERLIAILTNTFVPCNGRFPTLILLASVFCRGIKAAPGSMVSAETSGVSVSSLAGANAGGSGVMSALVSGAAIIVVIMIGVASTFLLSSVLSKTILKGVPSSFIMELPPYRKPKVLQVIARSFKDRTIFVLQRAVTVAAPCGIITWLLVNIPVGGSTLLSALAGFLEPLGRVLGMDGVILLAFILGFPANEIVIPIALMTYLSQTAMTQASSMAAMQSVLFSHGWTWMTAVSVMLFSLLHFPCGTTVYTIFKETGSKKWTLLSIVIPTVFACVVLALLQGIFRVVGMI